MSDVVISVEGLGKRYTLGPGGRSNERYTALRDIIANKARSLFRPQPSGLKSQLSGLKSQVSGENSSSDFWALKDVSFDIKQGEVVGIIGRNGAGKSTLLKILSRITDPTEGRIKIKGRIASLLEVGTGFHPELSGRENIYLNGAILGMTRAEIKAKFDEIVAFAEVEKFLDTPVKRYSSGMYVRLAFAVAAHLEPEILIVDEVLAVGDAEFQKKCLGKMQDVAGHGRTVLFVSHNMGAIRALCKRGIFLSNGALSEIGPIVSVVDAYLKGAKRTITMGEDISRFRRCGSQIVTIQNIETLGHTDESGPGGFFLGETIKLRFLIRAQKTSKGTFFIILSNQDGTAVLSSFQKDIVLNVGLVNEQDWEVALPALDLLPGSYSVSLGILDERSQDFYEWLENVIDLEVLPKRTDGRIFDNRLGLISVNADWISSYSIPKNVVSVIDQPTSAIKNE